MLIVGIRLVRDQAFKTVELFVKKLEEHAKTMVYASPLTSLLLALTHHFQPETVGPDLSAQLSEQHVSALPIPGGLVNTATGAASTLAEWAISSIGIRVSFPCASPKLYILLTTAISSRHLTCKLQ